MKYQGTLGDKHALHFSVMNGHSRRDFSFRTALLNILLYTTDTAHMCVLVTWLLKFEQKYSSFYCANISHRSKSYE